MQDHVRRNREKRRIVISKTPAGRVKFILTSRADQAHHTFTRSASSASVNRVAIRAFRAILFRPVTYDACLLRTLRLGCSHLAVIRIYFPQDVPTFHGGAVKNITTSQPRDKISLLDRISELNAYPYFFPYFPFYLSRRVIVMSLFIVNVSDGNAGKWMHTRLNPAEFPRSNVRARARSRPRPRPRPPASTFSFSWLGKLSANVLDGRCNDGAMQRSVARRCASEHLHLSSSLFCCLSRSRCAPRKSRVTLHFSTRITVAALRHQHLHSARAIRADDVRVRSLVISRYDGAHARAPETSLVRPGAQIRSFKFYAWRAFDSSKEQLNVAELAVRHNERYLPSYFVRTNEIMNNSGSLTFSFFFFLFKERVRSTRTESDIEI